MDILCALLGSFIWAFITFKLKQIKIYVTLLDQIVGLAVSLTLSVAMRFLMLLIFGV